MCVPGRCRGSQIRPEPLCHYRTADEQLAGVLSCVALFEGGEGHAAARCAWLKPALKDGEPVGIHRMYYAAARGLDARK